MRAAHCLAVAVASIVAVLCAGYGAVAADSSAPAEVAREYFPTAADTSAVALLSSAQYAVQQIKTVPDPQEKRIYYTQAITALVALYQLHGCEWALPPLQGLYAEPDCPELYVGFSADGRLLLRVEPLELQNPAFAQYVIYLCTLESHTALDLNAATTGGLHIKLADGTQLEAQQIGPEHPLWPNLQRLAKTFAPVESVPAGTGMSFKQTFAALPELPAPALPSKGILAVSLQWGSYDIELPYYGNEVRLEPLSTKR